MNEIAERLRKHVNDRGGPSLNGVWQLMLDAADEIDRLTPVHSEPVMVPWFLERGNHAKGDDQ